MVCQFPLSFASKSSMKKQQSLCCETETVTSIFVAHTQVTLIKNCCIYIRSQWPGVEHFQSS